MTVVATVVITRVAQRALNRVATSEEHAGEPVGDESDVPLGKTHVSSSEGRDLPARACRAA